MFLKILLNIFDFFHSLLKLVHFKIYIWLIVFKFCQFNIYIIILDKSEVKIDLVDMYGERAHAVNKGDTYVNLYLADKQCYELHKILFNTGNFFKFLLIKRI